MNEYVNLILFKAIVQAQIESLGMQAENTIAERKGHNLPYNAEAFWAVMNRLESILEANRP